MKKLGYLAIVLISVFALGSCVINVNDVDGDNYIRVTWADYKEPYSWKGTNPAITPTAGDPEVDVLYEATNTELDNLLISRKTESGNFRFTYRLSDGLSVKDCYYSIPTNTSSYDKKWVLVLDETDTTNYGDIYQEY
ncbi:MAG TPA: hypothetical protein PKO22_01475 [Treponemataceae bacterium]|nr:hypothetical protein [Treponemataceae bacterium]